MEGQETRLGAGDDLCILISTCDAYNQLAFWTEAIINRFWHPHPDVFFCGSGKSIGYNWIPMTRDPVDWMGITLDAAVTLKEHGYQKCYLILDDHPPVFSCHARHLNETIPQLMDKVQAIYIGLNGWGQPGRERNGHVLGEEYYYVENVSPEYPWKYQLHPGLWRVSGLIEILELLINTLPLERHNPWSFERRSGESDSPLRDAVKRSAFRIHGASMTAKPLRNTIFNLERGVFRAVRYLVGRIFGESGWRWVDNKWNFIDHYYEGPYPLIWKGAISKGKKNLQYLRLLRTHARWSLLRSFNNATGESF